MELYKKAYKGVFKGKYTQSWKITGYSMEEVLEEFMDCLNNNDEGMIEIQEIDVETKKRKMVKRVIIVNEFFLDPKDDIPLKF